VLKRLVSWRRAGQAGGGGSYMTGALPLRMVPAQHLKHQYHGASMALYQRTKMTGKRSNGHAPGRGAGRGGGGWRAVHAMHIMDRERSSGVQKRSMEGAAACGRGGCGKSGERGVAGGGRFADASGSHRRATVDMRKEQQMSDVNE